jgi:ATP-dependent Clp protease ATP-binding subunit ClpC
LKRAIQKYIEDPMAEEIIKGQLSEGDTIELGWEKDTEQLSINIVKPPKQRKKKEES